MVARWKIEPERLRPMNAGVNEKQAVAHVDAVGSRVDNVRLQEGLLHFGDIAGGTFRGFTAFGVVLATLTLRLLGFVGRGTIFCRCHGHQE